MKCQAARRFFVFTDMIFVESDMGLGGGRERRKEGEKNGCIFVGKRMVWRVSSGVCLTHQWLNRLLVFQRKWGGGRILPSSD